VGAEVLPARFTLDSRRQVLWAALYRHYFSRHIRPEFTVLELGAGMGKLINNVNATRASPSTNGPG
jgi:hypothetical protein